MIYRYQFAVGTAEFHRYGLDDRRARRLLARWLRLVWPRVKAHVASKYPGSMSDAINNGWHGQPEASIYRASCDSAYIVQCEPWPMIERFEATAEPIAEFNRVWGGW